MSLIKCPKIKQETNKPVGNNMMILTHNVRERSLEEKGKTKDIGIRWQEQISNSS